MALIEVRGYANKPVAKETAKGGYSTFTLSEKQKRRGRNGAPDTFERVFYDVVDFNSPTPPDEGSYVTVKGYLDIEKWEKGDKRGFNFRISAKEIEVSTKFANDPKPKAAAAKAPPADPFADADGDEGIPF